MHSVSMSQVSFNLQVPPFISQFDCNLFFETESFALWCFPSLNLANCIPVVTTAIFRCPCIFCKSDTQRLDLIQDQFFDTNTCKNISNRRHMIASYFCFCDVTRGWEVVLILSLLLHLVAILLYKETFTHQYLVILRYNVY